MHLLPLLGALTLLITSIRATTTSHPSSTEILYWPIGAAQPSTLARIAYDPASLESTLLAYNPPSPPTSPNDPDTDADADTLVRLGLFTTTPTNPKQWSGSLVSLSALARAEYPPTLRLHLGPANEVFHVSLAAGESVPGSGSAKRGEAGPRVELVSSEQGVLPRLNRPVVVGPDGQNAEEVPEKTLLQKYWWVLLIMVFLTMSGGGGGEGQ